MDEHKAGCAVCLVLAFLYSLASFIINWSDIGYSGVTIPGNDEQLDPLIWFLTAPGFFAFIPLSVFMIAMLVTWFRDGE
jgi:hypothetical protein